MQLARPGAPFAAIVAATILAGCISSAAPSRSCDRTCLAATLDSYLLALQSHDLAKTSLAPEFRATENGLASRPGDGAAKTITALGDIQRRYYDAATGQAAYLGTVREGDGSALIALRIRVEHGAISESEMLIARKGDALFSIEGFAADAPRPADPLPASDRVSRETMIASAAAYFEGLARHDGSLVPKIPGCERIENGTRVTNRTPRDAPANAPAAEFGATDCASGLERMTQIADVAHRRFPLVDEEAGVVMGVGLFLRPPGQTGNFAKRNLLVEFFETKGGKVSGIYAVMHYLEADAPDGTGWK